MNSKRTLRQVAVALTLLVAFLFQGTWALAGTTGSISGVVTSDTGAPIAGATVKVSSASQTGSTTTDATGHFVFLSLAPDTYSVSIQKQGYQEVSFAGVVVFADQQQTLQFRMQGELRTIARTTSQAAGALVKAGTTSDVYSVNAATAAKVTGLGGGGSLDQAYSAIATMPGAYVPVGQSGWYQTVYIRGGDYDQVGYEVDGVPVNRAFDNYPSNTASALGQQEVQVYTGAAPSNSEGQGLSGYINQVIKTGTYPGFGSADLALGTPIFYHKAAVEAGGASPDRRFSYYVGIGGYNQAYRYADQSNGASYSALWGAPSGYSCPATAPTTVYLASCYNPNGGAYMPGWNVLLPYNWYGGDTTGQSLLPDRETVMNFHWAIPHRNDSGRDDLQLLYQTSFIKTDYYDTVSDFTYGQGANWLNAVSGSPGLPWTFALGALTYSGSVNATQPTTAAASAFAPVVPYCFPSVPSALCNSAIPDGYHDTISNSIGMLKLQYQKNLGSNAYIRAYGYTVYSDWLQNGPISDNLCCTGVSSPDYELFTHTRGVSATFADQINPKNLLQLQGSYSTATSTRANNGTMNNGGGTNIGFLVSSANPTNGICYNLAGTAANCDAVYFAPRAPGVAGCPATTPAPGCAGSNPANALAFNLNALAGAQAGGGGYNVDKHGVPFALPGSCGGAPCEWYIADNGYSGRYNTVKPNFGSLSLTDEYDPSDRLHINLGLRYDSFQYNPSNTTGGARPFWFNAWNDAYCTNPATPVNPPVALTTPIAGGATAAACAAQFGTGFVPATITDVSSTQTYTVTQPRIALTYSLNPLNVLRFSYGKYDQAPNAAFEQYDAYGQNLPVQNSNFYTLGFTAPTHPVRPEISYNTDFSWEHQVKGSDVSWKITPFYRTTKDQIEQFYLNIKQNFVSGLNVGAQTSDGVEFQLQKGDFSRNGLSALLSYTYTNAYVKYSPASNGSTPVTGINQAIAGYNAYTSTCAAGNTSVQYGQALCGTLPTGEVAAPCYTVGTGAPVTNAALCTAGNTIANPYWNAPVQGMLDPNGQYSPYDLFPSAQPGAGSYGSFVTPHVATLVLNYKHDKYSITPAFQFSAGDRYGSPISTLGFDPATCVGALAAGLDAGRYPYGGNGSPADVGTCATQAVAIPNPATGHFDGIGAFRAPSRLTMSTQVTYDVSPRVTMVATLANIFDTCFGGSTGAWTSPPGISSSKVCGYGSGFAGVGVLPVGNNYNPPFSSVQPFQQQSYYPGIGSLPFNAYIDFKIKL